MFCFLYIFQYFDPLKSASFFVFFFRHLNRNFLLLVMQLDNEF